MNERPKTWPPQSCSCRPDTTALEQALQKGLGWGAEAGSTLSLSRAAAALLDWGEDNRVARLDQTELTRRVRRWLVGLTCCDETDFRTNWPAIAAHADDLVQDITPYLGRLEDAGNPQKRSDYGPRHWESLKRAIEQAVNGVI